MSHVILQVATTLCLVGAPLPDAKGILTSPYGPITTKPLSGQHISIEDAEPGRLLVRKALGREVPSPRTLVLVDDDPFGEHHEARTLLFDDIVIAVTNEDLIDSVVVSAAVGVESGSLLAVYTRARPQWIARVGTERDPEGQAAKFNWNVVAAGAEEFVTPVADVLTAVWRRYGIRPSEAGQIVLRPRLATTSSPLVGVGPDGWKVDDSNETVGMVWVVQALGIRRDVTPTYYWTGYLILVDDRTGKPFKGLAMP